jgi:protein translocase subunit secY/sec61 alpha
VAAARASRRDRPRVLPERLRGPGPQKRVLFTFGLLAIYRIGAHIPTPGLDALALEEFFKASAGGLLGFLDMFSGGALRRLSVFALGITPYITASIILQLLTVVWPYLEKLSKEGEMGRRKITQYTRYGTVLLSVVQGAGIALWLWGTRRRPASSWSSGTRPPRAARSRSS